MEGKRVTGERSVRVPEVKSRGLAARLLPLLLLGACASAPVPWTAPVQHTVAGFSWKRGAKSLAGDAEITSDARGNVRIRFTKTSNPLLEITSTTDGNFRTTAPEAPGNWSGRTDNVPLHLSLWSALAQAWRDALAAPEGFQEIHAAAYRAAIRKESGRVRELSVSSSDTAEVIHLVFR